MYVQICGVGFSLAVYYPFLRRSEFTWNVQCVIGLFLSVIGYTFWAISRIQLGSSFSILPSNKERLVVTGVYMYFSHPVYLFSTVAFFGYCLILGRVELLSFLIVIVPIQFYRAQKEARLLQDRFGEEYLKLAQKVIF
jgi:protein-S-isoprenylcysteine O-methyltransferase Ste14